MQNSSQTAYIQRRKIVILSLVLLPVCFLMALAIGSTSIPFSEVLAALVGGSEAERSSVVVQQIRLPRALLAALVGALLGICGATTQGLFRNPLADPSLIGVTAGASVGAAVMIFFAAPISTLAGLSGLGLISAGAFIGGLLAVLLVYSLATSNNGTSVATMLLVGIAITAIAGGVGSLLEFFADNEMLRRISLWRMGGLEGTNLNRVLLALAIAVLVCASLPRFSNALNALLLGESEARHLGINVQLTKLMLVVLVAAGVAGSVALAGSIAFVGLIVPHIMRSLIGSDHRYLLPMSAVGGAILLLLADTVARSIFSPIELPVGLVTALLGAPFFISLLRHRHAFGMR